MRYYMDDEEEKKTGDLEDEELTGAVDDTEEEEEEEDDRTNGQKLYELCLDNNVTDGSWDSLDYKVKQKWEKVAGELSIEDLEDDVFAR